MTERNSVEAAIADALAVLDIVKQEILKKRFGLQGEQLMSYEDLAIYLSDILSADGTLYELYSSSRVHVTPIAPEVSSTDRNRVESNGTEVSGNGILNTPHSLPLPGVAALQATHAPHAALCADDIRQLEAEGLRELCRGGKVPLFTAH